MDVNIVEIRMTECEERRKKINTERTIIKYKNEDDQGENNERQLFPLSKRTLYNVLIQR